MTKEFNLENAMKHVAESAAQRDLTVFTMQLNGLVQAEFSYDNPLGQLPQEVYDAIGTITEYMKGYYIEKRSNYALNNFYNMLRGDT